MTTAVTQNPDSVPTNARSFAHFPALDGLRGIAILWVILHNAPHYAAGAKQSTLVWLVALVAAVGWVGVQLFFVLSGFLITGNLLDSQRATNYYRAFFARRVLRIFPLYYLALIVGLIIVPCFFPAWSETPTSPFDQVWLWTFLYNWAHPFGTSALGFAHFWSLAVEEQFYLIWPFVIHRLSTHRVLRLCFIVAIAALIIRTAMRAFGASSEMVYEFTVCRMDALAVGAAAAAMLRTPQYLDALKRQASKLLPTALALTLIGAAGTWAYTRGSVATQTIGHSILAVVFALIILACIIDVGSYNAKLRNMLSVAPLRSVGKYSYGMYVLHLPIVVGMERLLPHFQTHFGKYSSIPFVGSVVALTYAAGALSYHLFEKHFLNLKRFFQPSTVMPSVQSATHHA